MRVVAGNLSVCTDLTSTTEECGVTELWTDEAPSLGGKRSPL
jgi:hypothetical protein